MKNRKQKFVVAATVAGLLMLPSVAGYAKSDQAASQAQRHALPAHKDKRACGAQGHNMACAAHVVTAADGASPLATSSYTYGYRPADIQQAYRVPAAAGAPTVAIVDAYDNPNAEADLAVYRTQFGLPACTTANGCFKKVNQTGGTTYPRGDVGWGQEIALDVDAVSATCPNCKILLVEATSNSFTDLMAAVDYAAAHASYVSNSYGADEFSGAQNYDSHFNKPGVAFTVSSGDNGYGVQYPASSRYVTAVGGTNLKVDSSGNRTETVWSGAGSGCSAYVTKPAWQTDTGCAKRTVADVSAVADPNTGLAIYDSYGSTGGNWMVFGGTSLAAPIVAAVYAAAGVPSANTYPASYPYATPAALFDVTLGTNGACSVAYLCGGRAGFDGPSGLGAPNGPAAFTLADSTGGTTTTTTAPVTTTTTTGPVTNLAPVIDSKTKSCGGTATCTFTVNAHDPEGKALTYSWVGAVSSSKSATVTYTSAGTKTVTVTVKDGVKVTNASISVSCTRAWFSTRITCS